MDVKMNIDEVKEMKNYEVISGIYSITNIKNGNKYIGISQNIYKRWKKHILTLSKGEHHQHNLQKEYDISNNDYSFEILEDIKLYDKYICKQFEDKYILLNREIRLGYEQKTNKEIEDKFYTNRLFDNKLKRKDSISVNYNKFVDINIPNNYMAHILYLATFMDEKGKVRYGNAKASGSFITKKDLFEIFYKISEKECYRTINYLFDNNIMNLKNNAICINSEFITKNKYIGSEYITIYSDFIVSIYSTCPTRGLKSEMRFLNLIPYMNKETNIICENPMDENYNKLKPLLIKDISTILEVIRVNKSDSYLVSGQQEKIMIKASGYGHTTFYQLNPLFIYSGDNYDDINIIKQMEVK